MADDHAIVREGVKRIVSSADELDVVGEAKNGVEVLQRVRDLTFDVLVLDWSMPGRNGHGIDQADSYRLPKTASMPGARSPTGSG